MQLTISGNDRKSLKLIRELAEKLGLHVDRRHSDNSATDTKENNSTNSQKLIELMEEISADGGIHSIKDPITWQKEIRKDKPLYGRD